MGPRCDRGTSGEEKGEEKRVNSAIYRAFTGVFGIILGMEISLEQHNLVVAERDRLAGELAQLNVEVKLLKDKLQYVLKQLFGSKSEKINPDQLQLLLEGAPAAVEAEAALESEEVVATRKRAARKPLAERLPENLPIVEEVIEPAEVQAAPELFRRIGEEVTVELDVTPAKFFQRHIIRPKYVRKDDRSLPPVVAPAPRRVIEHSFASVGLLVAILLGKYSDHLPLYRQEQIFKVRYGVTLSRKTMGGWIGQVAHQLGMIYEALRDEIRNSGYIQADETPVDFLDPGSGRCGRGFLWTYRASGNGVLFEWFPSRAADCLKGMLAGFKGHLQSDGYAAYLAYFAKLAQRALGQEVELLACWAHVRRKFFEAKEEDPLCAKVLAHIQELYRIEAELRAQGASPAERLAARQERSLPVLGTIEQLLRSASFLPKSLGGQAVAYTLELWERLLVYTRHGHLEIDNNLVENAIRPTAVGKKNWLFFGSAEAGQSSAIVFSLLESCRMLGLNPQEYLLDVLPRLPTMTNQTAHLYTPSKWLAARQPVK